MQDFYAENGNTAGHSGSLGDTSHSGDRDQEDQRLRPGGKKITETASQEISWLWWHASIIPAIWEV
jgi:hypothetical protein